VNAVMNTGLYFCDFTRAHLTVSRTGI